MKKLNINLISTFIFPIILLICFPLVLPAQDGAAAGNFTSSMEMKMLKNNDDSRTFTIKLTGEGENGNYPVNEATIDFYSLAGQQQLLIGNCKTDRTGNGMLTLKKEQNYLKDGNGVAQIKARFQGKGSISESESTVSFKNVEMSITLSEKDSAKTIIIKAASIGAQNERIPLKATTFNLYVQGLYSHLKIGDCFMESGEGLFEFPGNIPGDQNGKLNIFVRLEENEEFGNIEKTETATWGNHRSGYIEPERLLWTTGAPFWMIITLSILLIGVWSHYLYAVIQLVKIGQEGKKNQKRKNS